MMDRGLSRRSFIKSSAVAGMALAASLANPLEAKADSASGNYASITRNGVTYTGHTWITTGSAKATGGTTVNASQYVPATYIWTLVTLYRGSTYVGTASGYNNGATKKGESTFYQSGWSGTYYYAAGSFKAFDLSTNSYSSIIALGSTRSIATQALGDNFAYAMNEMGETYGSGLGQAVCGIYPDWIESEATNGEHGYIKASDNWVPEARNPSDALANFSTIRKRSIPVYELPANGSRVVGELDLFYGNDCVAGA